MIPTETTDVRSRETRSAALTGLKVGLIEVRPTTSGYVAKEMAGGLGKRIELSGGLLGRLLSGRLQRSFCAPPMILAQVAGVCRSFEHECTAYHTADVEDVDVGTSIAICLGSMVDYKNELRFLGQLRRRLPAAKIVVVGSFPSAMPELYSASADVVIVGDPETALISVFEDGYPSGRILKSERPDDLNSLPMPEWEPFIRNNYFARRPFSSERGVSIQKSKGCSMTCNYCPYAALYGKARHFDSDYVLGVLRHYVDRHGIRYFMFRDPNFGENIKEFRVFMHQLIESRLDIHWSCEARLDTFKQDEDLQLMAEAGLKYIITGIESSDDELLKSNRRRPIKKIDAFRKVAVLEDAGVAVQANFIIGFPGETEQSVLNTLQYANELNTMFATFHVFTPQPGTVVFDDYREKLLEMDWEDFSYSRLVWKHDTLSKEFLDAKAASAHARYYFRPRYILKHLSRLARNLV